MVNHLLKKVETLNETTSKISISDLNWKTWFMLVTLLVAAGGAAYLGAKVSVDIDFNTRVREALQQHINSSVSLVEKPCSYLVGVLGNYYYFCNGTNGVLGGYSTNGKAVANNAFGNLTIGRTWPETIVFKGNFQLANVVVPSLTDVVIYGNLTKNANGPIFNVSSVTDVTIDGGIWSGRNGTYSGSGIDITLSSAVTVKNIVMSDVYDYGLDIQHSDNVRVLDCDFNACAGDDDVSIHSSSNVLVDRCHSFNHTGWIAGATYSGFEVDDDSHYVTISNCLAWAPNDTTTNRAGFHLHIHAVGESSPSHVTFINDKAIGMGSWGFVADGHINGVDLINGVDNRFVDCEADFTQYYGFRTQNAKNITIIGGSATNARHATQGCGVFVGSNSTNIVVNALTCSGNAVDMKIYDVSDVGTVFEYCDLKSAEKIWDDGLRTIIHHCSGYADPFTQLVYTVGEIDGSNALATAGRCFLVPIEIPFDCYINKLGVVWGATSTGNVTLCLYKSSSNSPGNQGLAVQTANTVKGSANNAQEISITETFLHAGVYFLGVESNETTSILLRAANPSRFNSGTYKAFYFDVGGGYGALPDPAPAVTASTTVISGGYVIISRLP